MTMEIATPAPAPITSPEINIILLPAKTETHKKNMIQVSEHLLLIFRLWKREIGLVDLVLIPERSLAFISITMVVTISEILKNTGLTTREDLFFSFYCSEVLTSTVGMKDEAKGKMIEIVLGKSDKFDSLVPPVTNGKTP
ncbi:hypothetical protein Bca4012_040885 [Brassica carinata]